MGSQGLKDSLEAYQDTLHTGVKANDMLKILALALRQTS